MSFLSYSPYTDQVGISAFHERTTRYFLLLESPESEFRDHGAYATLTDNMTNDTTYLGAQLAARPN
ncbi:MAG TPA: hypothetical protein VE974_13240 [Thermoanaerobaculia bacterium]|nr:hypothetical protein [Thermoanaerobaculia bacterium]